ncbi:phage head spike fiber domain-containing protein [Rhodoferax aquaticus]|uniref:phage head spike fiber domain-containing protein n=1 Tax=Rhodoferax aquaticus TaxID=2527691 RepID=UPI003CCA1E67
MHIGYALSPVAMASQGLLAPSLQLDFLSGTLDPRITFTRAGGADATVFGSNGLLQTPPPNTPRFDYDPVTLQPRGLLIEEARTNLLLHSRDMTQAAWSKTDVTPTRNQVGIDGVANTACLMTEGVAGSSIALQNGAAVTAGSTITSSWVLKRGNTDWMACHTGDATDGARGWFNLNSGAKGSVVARGAGTNNSSTITPLGGGWYRCTVTTTPNGTYTIPIAASFAAPADNSIARVNNATYITDCAQLEVGASASSIIPTTTAAVTRAADNVVMTGTNFSSWYNSAAGSFVVEGDTTTTSNPATLTDVNDNSFNQRMQVRFSTSTLAQAIITSGGVVQTTPLSTSVVAGAVVKMGLSYASAGTSWVTNGSTVQAGSALTLPAPTQLRLGSAAGGGSEVLNGHIRSIRYYNTRLPDQMLRALTT